MPHPRIKLSNIIKIKIKNMLFHNNFKSNKIKICCFTTTNERIILIL